MGCNGHGFAASSAALKGCDVILSLLRHLSALGSVCLPSLELSCPLQPSVKTQEQGPCPSGPPFEAVVPAGPGPGRWANRTCPIQILALRGHAHCMCDALNALLLMLPTMARPISLKASNLGQGTRKAWRLHLAPCCPHVCLVNGPFVPVISLGSCPCPSWELFNLSLHLAV